MTAERGDNPCGDCGADDNVVWFTDNPLWNAVIRESADEVDASNRRIQPAVDPILCIPCFLRRAHVVGCLPDAWRVIPEWPWTPWVTRQRGY